MKREQLLTAWSSLRPKLQKLVCLGKNKQLIKEAVQFHQNQASGFIHQFQIDNPRAESLEEGEWIYSVKDYRSVEEIERLVKPTGSEEVWPGRSSQWKKYYNLVNYFAQKEKNEKVVRECKEVLEKLETI